MLGNKGVTRLMIEGGPTLAKAFLSDGLVDELAVFQAPFDLPQQLENSDAPPAQSDLQFMGIENYANSSSYKCVGTQKCGPDTLTLFRGIA